MNGDACGHTTVVTETVTPKGSAGEYVRAMAPRADQTVADLFRLGGLAAPLIGTQIALLAMPWTDALVMGRLGPDSLAGGTLGASLLSSVFVLFSCVLGGLGPMTASSLARGEIARAAALTRAALLVVVGLYVPLVVVIAFAEPLLRAVGQPTSVARSAGDLLVGASGSLLASPILLVLRHVLAARRRAHVVTAAMALGVPANAGLDVALAWGIDGWLPALGVRGIGIGTSVVTIAMVAGVAWWARRELPSAQRPRISDAREIVVMGLPIAIAVGLEVGAFLVSSFVMGWLGASALAAHAVAMQVTQLAFVVPNGLAQAAAVHVAGSSDRRLASRVSLGLALVAALITAITIVVGRDLVAGAYLALGPPEVRALAAALLAVVAAFHVADALQVVAAGCLRGRGDTRTAMRAAGAAYAVVTPTTAVIGLALGAGPIALWWGLGAGVWAAAAYLARRALVREYVS